MARAAKWWLIITLTFILHICYLTVTAASLTGSVQTYVLPFGDMNAWDIQRAAQYELLAAAASLLVFAVLLLRREHRHW